MKTIETKIGQGRDQGARKKDVRSISMTRCELRSVTGGWMGRNQGRKKTETDGKNSPEQQYRQSHL